MKLVLIEWLDSHYVEGWHTNEPKRTALVWRSVGWIVYEGTEATTIASHVTQEEDPQRNGEMTIPAVAIVNTFRLFTDNDPEPETVT